MQAKIIGGLVGLLLLAGLVFGLKHYKRLADTRGEKLEAVCQQVRTSTGQPKLKCADVVVQIGFMGETIKAQSSAIASQNAAVDAMGRQTAAAQAEAARASRIAQERSDRVAATVRGLDASSRASERQSQPCVPSKALREAWR